MNRGNLVRVSQVVRDGDLPLFHGFPDKPAERRSAVSPADRPPLIVATIVYVSTIVFIASIVVILIKPELGTGEKALILAKMRRY